MAPLPSTKEGKQIFAEFTVLLPLLSCVELRRRNCSKIRLRGSCGRCSSFHSSATVCLVVRPMKADLVENQTVRHMVDILSVGLLHYHFWAKEIRWMTRLCFAGWSCVKCHSRVASRFWMMSRRLLTFFDFSRVVRVN